jgi:hypothetical protein
MTFFVYNMSRNNLLRIKDHYVTLLSEKYRKNSKNKRFGGNNYDCTLRYCIFVIAELPTNRGIYISICCND